MHGPARQAAKALKCHPNNHFYEQRMAFMYEKKLIKLKIIRAKKVSLIILDVSRVTLGMIYLLSSVAGKK